MITLIVRMQEILRPATQNRPAETRDVDVRTDINPKVWQIASVRFGKPGSDDLPCVFFTAREGILVQGQEGYTLVSPTVDELYRAFEVPAPAPLENQVINFPLPPFRVVDDEETN